MQQQLDQLVGRLHQQKSLKAWSVIISFFGDAIVPRGGCVSARTIQTVMQHLGIDAGTVRTALSRLATDGWMVRHRQGRFSFYHLSDTGYEPFRQAALRIYAAPPPGSDAGTKQQSWMAVFVNSQDQLNTDDLAARIPATVLTSTCLLLQNPDQAMLERLHKQVAPGDCMKLTGSLSEVPQWIKSRNASDDLAQQYSRLVTDFSSFNECTIDQPVVAVATRCLLIHEWRRVLLRSGSTSLALLPDDWPGPVCHQFVAALYQRISPQAEGWLNDNALPAQGCVNQPSDSRAERFL